jgi:hypothetical protein
MPPVMATATGLLLLLVALFRGERRFRFGLGLRRGLGLRLRRSLDV